MQSKQFWWIPLPAVAIDRVLKLFAQNALSDGEITAIPGFLTWHLTHNPGAAFSILSGRSIFLIALTLALIAGIVIWLLRSKSMPLIAGIGLWMVAGGGIGNLLDRIIFGSVIDFIRLDFISFPIFNPADVFVCIGAGLTLLSLITARREEDIHE